MASIIEELKRRQVFRVSLAYGAMAWLLLQIADTILPAFDAPVWTLRALIVFVAAGLPIVIIISWVFEVTPEGVKRTDEVPVDSRFARQAGRKLDFIIIAFLSLALTTIVIDQYVIERITDPGVSTIAVLPLSNYSGTADDYFVDGMTDAIIASLSQISALRVISRNSVMRFKGSQRSSPAIAAELGADAVITGSVARNGNQVQINAQLVNVATDTNLWGETFNREFDDIFSLQSEIAKAIAESIQVEVSAGELERLATTAETSADGYDDYLKGMERFYRLTPTDLEVAIDYFDRALEQNPNSALALSGLGASWIGLQQMGFVAPSVAAPNSEAASLRALKIDPGLAEPYQWLAVIRAGTDHNWNEADRLFSEAIRLNRNFADARISYAHISAARGHFEKAFEQSNIAMELDPYNGWVIGVSGVIHYQDRRYEEAIKLLERALQLSPDLPFVWLALAGVYHNSERFDDAIQAEASYLDSLGMTDERNEFLQRYATNGYLDAMTWLADRMAEISRSIGAQAMWTAFRYAHVGDKENTIEWLLRAYEQNDPNVIFLRLPEFYPLHSDPRVHELMVKLAIL